MTRVGVTGHQKLPADEVDYITAQVHGVLQRVPTPLVGYSSLAAGADQLFAAQILDTGGQLHAVIPARGYETTFDAAARTEYDRLLAASSETTRLGFTECSEEAFDAAGKWVVEHCDLLIAVWDGLPARGLGGTADAVAHARSLQKDIRIIWPPGLMR